MKKYMLIGVTAAMLLLTTACGGQAQNSSGGTGVTDTGVATSDNGEASGNQLVVKATNYTFDQKEYHVKKGEPITIVFQNEQGNHGLMIPALNVDLNSSNTTATVTPQQAGEFDMACSIMCGSGHSTMVAKLIVDEA